MKLLILLVYPLFLFAHSLSTTASYENNELFIESFFSDGKACQTCPFTIKNNDEIIFAGKLDEEGVFEKSIKLTTPFKVFIDGGMGHRADVLIKGNEMNSKEKLPKNDETKENKIYLDEDAIRAIIKSELKKQNAKIKSMIEKNKSNLEKMLVSLGYILGLFGIWQLFARRIQK